MIKDRIIQFLSKEGLSPSQFAEILGIQRSSISHILSGRNKPSYDFFSKLINSYPNINLEWFFNGEGNCYKDIHNSEIPFNEYNNITEHEITPPKDTEESPIVTNVKQVKRVLLMFTDGTFEVYDN